MSHTVTSTPWRRRAAIAAMCLLAILPVIVANHLPLLDAQGHEARLVVLRDIILTRRGSPFYELAGFNLPNVAFDVIGLGLIGIMGPEDAGRVFFGLTLVLTVTGVSVLNRVAIGRWSLAPLFATLFLYNLVTILGFFSYAFGFALVPWALAGWKSLSARRPVAQALFGGAVGLILLFCHVFDFGIFAVMAGGFIVTKSLTDRLAGRPQAERGLIQMLALVPAVAAYALMAPAIGGHPRFEKNLLATKLFGIAKSVTCASFAGDIAFGVGALLFGVLILISPRRRLAPGFALGLAGLAILYVLLPDKLATGSYVDKRMPIALALLLLAGLDLRLAKSRLSVALVCLIGLAITAKQIAITVLWRAFTPTIDALAGSLNALPSGSIILQAECEPESRQILSVYGERQPSLTHVPAMAAFDDSRFVAATWAIAGQHTIKVKDAYRGYYELQDSFGSSTCDTAGYKTEYDRIVRLSRQNSQGGFAAPVFFLLIRPLIPNPLSGEGPLIASTPVFALYRVQ